MYYSCQRKAFDTFFFLFLFWSGNIISGMFYDSSLTSSRELSKRRANINLMYLPSHLIYPYFVVIYTRGLLHNRSLIYNNVLLTDFNCLETEHNRTKAKYGGGGGGCTSALYHSVEIYSKTVLHFKRSCVGTLRV